MALDIKIDRDACMGSGNCSFWAPGVFDLILYCPHHPYGYIRAYTRDTACRKPRPGMAYEARDRLGLDLSASLMVGDMEVDRLFAENAGIPVFYWAHEFF